MSADIPEGKGGGVVYFVYLFDRGTCRGFKGQNWQFGIFSGFQGKIKVTLEKKVILGVQKQNEQFCFHFPPVFFFKKSLL